jgi:glycosyltransferase involved in cell wall biosynthesis
MKQKTSSRIRVSVIVSAVNIADQAEGLVRAIASAFEPLKKPFEMIVVDDGSSDGTFGNLSAMARADKRLRIIRLRTTFGEAAALDAGFRASRGEAVVYLSGRVRVSAADLPGLLRRLDAGADFVSGLRTPRRDSRLNQWISRGFNRLVSRITRVRLHDVNSGVFAARRNVLESVPVYGDMVNFIPVLAAQQGYRTVEEPVEQLAGTFRQSKYPKEYVQRLLDLLTVFFLTRYSRKPIHFMGFVGAAFAAVGLVIELYLFVYRILGFGAIAGRPLLILGALLLVIGIQMVSIGLIGEMIIFTHADDIEPYNIEETLN